MLRRFFVLFLALLSTSASAEYCWMVGCVGEIGYVYIPSSQIHVTAGTTSQRVSKGGTLINYTLDYSSRLFKEFGLPPIGASVTLNVRANLLSHEEISLPAIRQEIKQGAYVYDEARRMATLRRYSFDSSLMAEGARLTILGYTGDALWGSSSLFALVRIESD